MLNASSIFVPGESKLVTSGKRVHERFDVRLPVTLVLPEGEVAAVTRNASLGGVFVETTASVVFGSTIKLRLRLPALHEDSELDVTVRWKQPDGIGVQFGSLRALEVWGLTQLAKSHAG